MIATNFPEAFVDFVAPPGMSEEQVKTIKAWSGRIHGGSCDGSIATVTAWRPTDVELARLNEGGCVFLTVLGGLPPHCLTTSFEEATAIA